MERENQNEPLVHQLGLVNIVEIRPIEDPKLIAFLKEKYIPLSTANSWMAQLKCELNGKTFMVLGCRNPTGHYEVVGPEGNGSTGPLSYTHRDSHEPRIDLFNNQLDYLSVKKVTVTG